MQTTYISEPINAFRGMLYDNGPNDVISRAYEGLAGAASPFGVPMTHGTSKDTQAKIGQVNTALLLGVAIHRNIAPGTPGSEAFVGEEGIEDKQTVDLLTKGRIWVKTRVAVTPTDPVFFRVTTTPGVPGDWEIAADGTETVAVPNARWLTTSVIGGLAVLELSTP
jgi:hypothetical protein